MDSLATKKKDPELRKAADTFLEAFKLAASSSDEEESRISKEAGWYGFQGGTVEFTDGLVGALAKLVARASRLLGSACANEKAIHDLALEEAQQSFVEKAEKDATISRLIGKIFDEGTAQYEFLVPNYLFIFDANVQSIDIGPVRAWLTSELAKELQAREPNNQYRVVPGQGFSIQFVGSPAVVNVGMHGTAWLVSTTAIKDNVEEEAKWLIDVAVSLLRLHYEAQDARFPGYGAVEPHPLRPRSVDQVGIKIRGKSAFVGGSSVPPAYVITPEILRITADKTFQAKAKMIFEAVDKSVGARVRQGLGWLTRGRQAEDRAERLLYFFTAIEALLSFDDKTAPVIQTIARHGAVLLTDKVADRIALSTEIKKLYSLRSATVHNGNRGVRWNAANKTQYLAEVMFTRVLDVVDLGSTHAKFCDGLGAASFGAAWPAVQK